MRDGLGMSADEMHQVFAEWNTGVLDSYLIEITRDILAFKDKFASLTRDRTNPRLGAEARYGAADEANKEKMSALFHKFHKGAGCRRRVGRTVRPSVPDARSDGGRRRRFLQGRRPRRLPRPLLPLARRVGRVR